MNILKKFPNILIAGQLLAAPLAMAANESGQGASGLNERPAEMQVVIRALSFAGNTVLDAEELSSAIGLELPASMTFSDLEQLAERVTAVYRERGYPLARAVLPRQDLTDGGLQLTIIEGRIGNVRLRNASHLDDSLPLGILRHNLCPETPGKCANVVINEAAVERAVGLLSDLPGITATTEYATGEQPGTVDIIATVRSTRRFGANATLDNYGSAATGIHRLGTGGFVHGALLRDDLIQGNVLATRERLYQYLLDYSLPAGFQGTRVGLSASRSSYFLSGSFENLGVTGESDGVNLFVSHPLLRSLRSNAELRIDAGFRKLRQDGPIPQLQPNKAIFSASARLSANTRDAALGTPAYSTFSSTLTIGELKLRDAYSEAFDASPAGNNSAGRYAKLQASVTRLQSLAQGFSFYGAVTGQLAHNNLDSAEKTSIGGADGVRAYPLGEGSGDDMLITSVELRHELPEQGGVRATLGLFYDYGVSQANHRPLNNGQKPAGRNYAGAGLGLTLNWTQRISARFYWARTIDSPASAIDGMKNRFGFQLQGSY